jgi:hypothetical protein
MDKIKEYLLNWTETYFRSRDAFHRNINSMKKEEKNIVIEFKDKKERIYAAASLDEIKSEDITQNISIVTLNNRKNVEFLNENWSKYKDFSIKIYFINPFSTTDIKWIINPHIHSKICDESSLKAGLIAMFETVEPLTKEILEKKI